MNGLCRITGKTLVELFSLGDLYVNNFVDKDQIHTGEKFELKLGMGPTGLVQLWETYPPEKMYETYWYQSSINELMRAQLEDFRIKTTALVPGGVGKDDVVLDIASNDGQQLTGYCYDDKYIFNRPTLVGVDPSDVAGRSPLYEKHQMHLINGFFSAPSYLKDFKPAKLITCAAMFYDLEDPRRFVKEVRECLTDDGIFGLQLSYLPLIIHQNSWDGIGEEHLCYYSLKVLLDIMTDAGFTLLDVEVNEVNSGSIRLYLAPTEYVEKTVYPPHVKALWQYRINSLLEYEEVLGVTDSNILRCWKKDIDRSKDQLVQLLTELKAQGKRVWGYGASTKGNTILQYCGLGPDLIEAIADRSPQKVGKYTIGTGIPILSEQDMRSARPDYLLALPYTFISAFLQREKTLIDSGTKFIVPLPTLEVL